jgi:NAD(P)-dependent dehydrogenase (short-subunit alcohol dehydrogenase family)
MAAADSAKIALVTGANKGIGFETARHLGRQGASVLIGARDETRGRKAADILAGEGATARWIALDVSDPASIAAAVAEVDRAFGRLDILVNNAGIGLDSGPPSGVDIAAMRKTLDTNFFGAFATLQAFLPLIRKSSAGRVVNVSSALGSLFHLSDPQWVGAQSQFVPYSISKTAMNMMTVLFANELRGTPVKVNSVEPGFTQTDMTGGHGFATADVSAQVIVRYATLADDGPSGGYFDQYGRMPW